MNLLVGQDERVAAWLAPLVEVERFCPPFVTIGFLDRGSLAGAALFTGFNGANIELTIGGRATVRRGAWRAIRSYAFDQLQCRRVTVIVRASNRRVREMAVRFGFRPEAYLEGWFTDDDGALFGMRREDCRW